jgi:glyoxylase-like metal-dependent hydrolase (beta-lactamase superfamily II)
VAIASVRVPSPAQSPVITIKEEAAKADIAVAHVRNNFALLQGSGGNIGVLTGHDGAVMLDAGIAVSRGKILAALAELGATPIKYLINTHWHFDHTDGNEWVRREGATIVAQENTLKRLSETVRVEDWNYTFPPAAQAARPTVTFKDAHTLWMDGATLDLGYYGPAHTDSDIYVHVPEIDVLYVADTFWNGHYPFIDYDTGGSIDGMIRAAEANVAKARDTTAVIPGHGPIGDRADLRAFRDMLVTIRANVAALKQQGKSLDQIVAAKPSAAYDEKWGGFVIDPAFFTRLVYRGV